jgi:hypothetical protein
MLTVAGLVSTAVGDVPISSLHVGRFGKFKRKYLTLGSTSPSKKISIIIQSSTSEQKAQFKPRSSFFMDKVWKGVNSAPVQTPVQRNMTKMGRQPFSKRKS